MGAASGADAPRLCLYFSLYHEAVAANLLERLALHGGLCDAAGEDALCELADYAVRQARPSRAPPSRRRRADRRKHNAQLLFLTTDAGSKAEPHEQCVSLVISLVSLYLR